MGIMGLWTRNRRWEFYGPCGAKIRELNRHLVSKQQQTHPNVITFLPYAKLHHIYISNKFNSQKEKSQDQIDQPKPKVATW